MSDQQNSLMLTSDEDGACSARVEQVLRQLTYEQVRWVIARAEVTTDKQACGLVGMNYGTYVHLGDTRKLMDEVVRLMLYDAAVTALHIRRRALARAMAVKVSLLDSDDERVRDKAATDIIEWELGKAPQHVQQQDSEQLEKLGKLFDMIRGTLDRPGEDGDEACTGN